MAVGHLLLQSFWANEAIFQLMMLAYNADGYIRLFLLFKMNYAREAEYRQQLKTFRLKYIFLAGRIIRTARSVVIKLSEKYPYHRCMKKARLRYFILHVSIRCFDLNLPKKSFQMPEFVKVDQKNYVYMEEMMLN